MNKIKSLWNKLRNTAIFKAFVIWIVVVIVLVFMVDKLLMPAFAGAFAKTGEVPNLEGLSQQVAESTLTKAGFKFEWVEEGRYSSQVPAGMVLVQMPKAGRTAKIGRTVKLTKSLGLRKVIIPDLRGKSQKQADISLSRAGLVQGEVIKGAHQSIPRGVVIRTIPMAGDTVRVGDTVKVVISAGVTTGRVLLPNFEGILMDEIYPEMDKLGFKVGSIKRRKSEDGARPGSVIETFPKYGDYLKPGARVDFIIAD
ncbi:PASTA domain-containing protein [Fibrobacter sp.]|uniref:PASTA domain-containing protein n=1 Tax=Fibrobacter sp. TaxID=35828 RepID=UPI0025C3B24E|nr:PASTA domain-containing protein [Fibrobacter sp.]MBR3071487.1 PASTA domain-containing protein [Fibrobacter sp.]